MSEKTLIALPLTPPQILERMLTVDGVGSGLDADLLDGNSSAYFLPAASYTAADVLAKLLTVDGSGSGLDADTVRGAAVTGGGTIALGGFTATVPETGTIKMQGLTGTFTLAQNTAATDVTGALFAIATYRGAQLDYVITRGSTITRKGTLQIAGDATSPSVSDVAAAVGAAGITWSAVVSGGNVQVQIATDNSIATGIRLRWELSRWLEP